MNWREGLVVGHLLTLRMNRPIRGAFAGPLPIKLLLARAYRVTNSALCTGSGDAGRQDCRWVPGESGGSCCAPRGVVVMSGRAFAANVQVTTAVIGTFSDSVRVEHCPPGSRHT